MSWSHEIDLVGYQSQGPAVPATPEVQYGYAGPASGENYDRISSMMYPNGRVLDYGYDDNDLDNAISRVDYLADASGSASGHLVDYEYEGLGTMFQQADANGVTLNTGLNQFGEVSQENWTTGTGCSTTSIDNFTYGYDRDGDVLYKDNQVDSAESELYHSNSTASGDDNSAYDPLGRLTSFERGTLSSSGHNGSGLDTVSSPSTTQSFALDAVGNQTAVTTNGTPVASTVDSRNELTVNGSADLTQDHNGNTTTDQNGNTYVYNAWNQIVGGTETNSYDALGRRVTSNNDDFYYSGEGQIIQDDKTVTGGCGPVTSVANQYVYNTDYVNDLLLRDDNSTGGSLGVSGSGLGERLFAEHDANFNVTSLANTSGDVVERFVYDPYGSVTVLSTGWTSTTDSYNWNTLFQGMWQDSATSLYYTPNRDYSAALGRWMEADPAGYVNGASLYQAFDSDPAALADPSGTTVTIIKEFPWHEYSTTTAMKYSGGLQWSPKPVNTVDFKVNFALAFATTKTGKVSISGGAGIGAKLGIVDLDLGFKSELTKEQQDTLSKEFATDQSYEYEILQAYYNFKKYSFAHAFRDVVICTDTPDTPPPLTLFNDKSITIQELKSTKKVGDTWIQEYLQYRSVESLVGQGQIAVNQFKLEKGGIGLGTYGSESAATDAATKDAIPRITAEGESLRQQVLNAAVP